jgi:uncharacterized protein YhdP
MRRRDKILWAVGAVVVVLVAARIAFPYVVKDWVNRKLAAIEAYDGHVNDVDISLLRGAYSMDGIRITKTGIDQSEPFFDADSIDFSVEWRSLLRGRLVSESVIFSPNLNLVQAEADEDSQLGTEENWGEQLEALFPFEFNTIVVRDGVITFSAPGIDTKDAITATDVDGQIDNLTNVEKSGEESFATFEATATVLDSGSAAVAGSANPLAETPTFDVNLTVKNVQLPEVNPWLREYVSADAEAGNFELYTELAAADGKFEGYAKPILQNVDIYSSEEPEDNPFKRLWEGLVDFAAEILEDEGSEQVAARVPFSGTIDDPDASLLQTVVSVLRNAFVSAFARSLEGSVSIRDVRDKAKTLGKDAGGDGDAEAGA